MITDAEMTALIELHLENGGGTNAIRLVKAELDRVRAENARLRSALDPRARAILESDDAAKVARGLPAGPTA